jgi:4-amino-4-deoxy-L-arabinose transferase-like glycosyltransferase
MVLFMITDRPAMEPNLVEAPLDRTRAAWRPVDLVFPLVLAAIHAALWWWANHREGVWLQVPAIDQAHDLRTALILRRALANGDMHAVVSGWVHASPVHTPLVPFASAILMLVFGESRLAAEAVLPLATAVWLVATYAVVARLYDRATARKTTALVSTFPVFLIYSRTYLFDHPLAAVFASGCWALLVSDGFLRTAPSAGFGVLAGLTALARGGGFVFLVGPAIVALLGARREGSWMRRLGNCGMAVVIAGALSATWYLPNLTQFTEYVRRATYGDEALLRTGGTGAFSIANGAYYLTWLTAQGPGVPMAVVAGLAWIVGNGFTGGKRRGSAVAWALALVFAIDFLLLLAAAQHEAARYFQPLMPLVALAVVRAVDGVQRISLRRVLGGAVTVLALHHVIALSLFFGLGALSSGTRYVRALPLWDHTTYFRRLVDSYGLRTPQDDFRIPETIDLLSRIGLPSRAVIGTMGAEHGFYQPNGLELEAARRQLDWQFIWSPPLEPADPSSAARALPAADVDAILLRSGGPTGIESASLASSLPDLFDPATRRFDRIGDDLVLGDGSIVTVFKRRGVRLAWWNHPAASTRLQLFRSPMQV